MYPIPSTGEVDSTKQRDRHNNYLSTLIKEVVKLYVRVHDTKKAHSCHNDDGSGIAELAKASVIFTRDPGSNHGSDRTYFLILFLSHLNPNQ
jgi:hypothetical protein